MIDFLLAALLAQALPPPAEAAGWRLLDSDPEGELRVDPASLGSSGGIARPLVYLRMTDAQQELPMHQILRMRIDCAARTAGFQAGEAHDASGARVGQRIESDEDVEMNPIQAGSMEERLHGLACPASS